jgi:pimeloyl-ACP methyl ester carboxylesterase
MMRITHGRMTLELHELARRNGPALLLLHALYGSSDDWGKVPAVWPGAVYALDFAGHGKSDWVPGGVYYPENLAADIDAALQHIGGAALAGAGLGAYLGLLVAGARRELVSAALLLPGAGVDGGGPAPDFDAPFPGLDHPMPGELVEPAADPMVRLLDSYVRPVHYVEPFAHAARRVLLVEDGTARPPWWEAARRSPTAEVVSADLRGGLQRLAERTITQ